MSLTNRPMMTTEARSAPHRIAELLSLEWETFRAIGQRLRSANPPFAVTVGRGSSDHAGLYARALIENGPGLVTASAAPSAVTLYGASLNVSGALVVALSQSGASPDIVRFVDYARGAGAITLALLNTPDSPLGRAAETTVALHAGEEQGVAATKSWLATVAASALLVAEWAGNDDLRGALADLPHGLGAALDLDWAAALDAFNGSERMFVIGRGYALAAVAEMALKLKEVAGIQAEAFSAAEMLHGPLGAVEPDRPALVLAIEDETLPSVMQTVARLRQAGARVLILSSSDAALAQGHVGVKLPRTRHPALDPLVAVQGFYLLAASLALARGLDPDRPPHLAKVTRTL